jgi:hypothetical protein
MAMFGRYKIFFVPMQLGEHASMQSLSTCRRHAHFASDMVMKMAAILIIQVLRHDCYMDIEFLYLTAPEHRE